MGQKLCAWCPSFLVRVKGDGDVRQQPEIYMPAPAGEGSKLIGDIHEQMWQQIRDASGVPAHMLGGKPWATK